MKITVIIHLILGLALGVCASIVYWASTDHFRTYIQEKIEQSFERDFDLQMHCKVQSVELFPLRVALTDVHIGSADQGASSPLQWSVIAEKMHVTGSWFSVIRYGVLKIHMQFDHVIMMESFEKKPEKLSEFCAKMFKKIESTWLMYEGVSINDGMLFLKRTIDDLYVQIPYVGHMQTDMHATKFQMYIRDGIMWYSNGMSIENIAGSFVGEMPLSWALDRVRGDMSMNFNLHKAGAVIPGFLAGAMQRGQANLTIKTEDGSIVIDSMHIKCTPEHCWCSAHVQATPEIVRYFNISELLSDLQGHVGIMIEFDAYNIVSTLQVSVTFKDLLYKKQSLIPGGVFAIKEHTDKGISGILQIQDKDWMQVQVVIQQDKQTVQAYNLVSINPTWMRGWMIQPEQLRVDVVRSQDGAIRGTYQARVQREVSGQQRILQGSFTYDQGVLRCVGTIDQFEYQVEIQMIPDLVFKKMQVWQDKRLVVDIASDEQDTSYLAGSVDFSIVKAFMPEPLKMSFAQEGSFVGRGYIKDGVWHAMIQTYYAHIRVPFVYNVIQNFNAACEIDFSKQNIVLKDVLVQWHEGSMSCSRATFWFDKKLDCYALHVPIMFDKVMMSYTMGIYGLLSGRILLSKQHLQDPMVVEGKLLLHNAEIRENILSSEFHEIIPSMVSSSVQQNFWNNWKLDIGLQVFDALRIQTSFMSARAMVELLLQGTVQKPKLEGQIKLLDGLLQFPYKPIAITGGKIILVPDQPLDPIIELSAKGKLKKYTLSLRAWGTALDPHIQFDAQPYLTEEQILSLLMLGVEDQSLGLMVPAFLTQKLKDIIFGPALSSPKLKNVFDVILKSMKYVRFLPQFTNQADRGGVRGIFEIDATENLHGKIDTNFTHIEDTKFDIDYNITDDVTLRLQKDGPSTYGGEVEFGWKFS